MTVTANAAKKCAEWLAYCREIGGQRDGIAKAQRLVAGESVADVMAEKTEE